MLGIRSNDGASSTHIESFHALIKARFYALSHQAAATSTAEVVLYALLSEPIFLRSLSAELARWRKHEKLDATATDLGYRHITALPNWLISRGKRNVRTSMSSDSNPIVSNSMHSF
jgi:hypothetical protein